MLIVHSEGVRLISPRRARTLRKKGVHVSWSQEYFSHYWCWSDLIERKQNQFTTNKV